MPFLERETPSIGGSSQDGIEKGGLLEGGLRSLLPRGRGGGGGQKVEGLKGGLKGGLRRGGFSKALQGGFSRGFSRGLERGGA